MKIDRRSTIGLWSSLLLLAIGLSQADLLGQEQHSGWTRFRGENGSGLDSTAPLPTDLNVSKATWIVDLPGEGHSSPIISNNQVFVTCFSRPDQYHLLALDLKTGALNWDWKTSAKPHPMHRLNNVASSTPASDGEQIYVLIPEADNLRLVAIDAKGSEVWHRDFGRWVAQHGFGTSPTISGDKIIFLNSQEPHQNMPEPGKSEIIAVSRKDGADVWRTPIAGQRACYGALLLKEVDGKNDLILGATTGEGLFGLESSSGKQLWSKAVFEQRIVGSPILVGDRLICNNGSGGGGNYLVGVDLKGASPEVTLEVRRSVGYVPTLIAVNGLLFSCTDNGLITCWELEKGTERWAERISSGFWSSPVSDGQNLYCVDKEGTVYVVGASATFKAPTKFPLGEATEATPAIHAGRIIFRTLSKITCFGS